VDKKKYFLKNPKVLNVCSVRRKKIFDEKYFLKKQIDFLFFCV